jgi:penicillin-binding protein 1A
MAARTATGAATRGRARKKKSPVVRWIKRIIISLLTIFCIGFIIGSVVFISNYKEAELKLDNLPALMAGLQQQPTIIYSADGEKLYIISAEYRRPVESKDIPKVVKDALVAAEDVRFYKHNGVDILSLFRIAAEAVKDKGHFSQGGSTLTMQLAKRLYTSPEKTLKRKVQDMALAVAMEKKLTKDQIITLYLNQVFFGNNAYGIRAAAEVYFGKEIGDLDASDAAMLVRCVRRPSDETPISNYKKALENRNVVLKIMHDEGMINDELYNHSLREKPHINPKPPSTSARLLRAPYFVKHVTDTIKQDMPDIDITAGGYKIYTTLDAHLQSVAEKAVRDTVAGARSHKVTTGACILIDYKGRILAEVGGVDYKKDQYNAITSGSLQPGSSFKSFLYSAAIDQGVIDENSSVSNDRKVYTDQWGITWNPQNDNAKYSASASVRTAFAFSYNCAAAHLLDKIGPQALVDYAHNVFGITSEIKPQMSIALGANQVSPLEMARGYSVFMTGGDRVDPYPIDRIVGPDGQVVRKYEPRIAANVLSPRVVNQMRDLQFAVVDNGTATRVVKGKVPNARGKTGTTSANKDAWFDGYSDGLLCVSWVANENWNGHKWVQSPMSSKIFGGTTATQIWVPVMKAAHDMYAVPQPDRDVVQNDTNPSPFASNPAKAENQPSEADQVGNLVPPSNPTDQTPPNQNPDNNNPNGDGITDAPPQNTPPDSNPPKDDLPPVTPIKPIEQPKPKLKPKPVEYVDVEICADSHELATMYCPETVVRTYVKGTEPKAFCHIHRPH